jgi:phosphoglycolate phosphatase-like HAD superfamily hydrolase
MTEPRSLVVYVDVDDTLVRSFGSKRIPMTQMVQHVRDLSRSGVALYAWSSGGGDYARETAKELDLEDCFKAFLPKPNVIIDDQAPAEWRRLVHVHPAEASSKTIQEYVDAVNVRR